MNTVNENKKDIARMRMMGYVIRDEKTDEIIGIDPKAPDDVKDEYSRMLAEEDTEIAQILADAPKHQ